MAFDDDDNPHVQATPVNGTNAATEDADDDAPDYKLFLSMFDKSGVSSKAIRKGEKDFESHGTRAQDNLLEASRKVLDNVLGYTRIHREEAWVRGWCFPDWWAETDQTGEQEGLLLRDRVVMIEHERGSWQKDIGRAVPGKVERLGTGRLWLLPEEALYLVERGTLDLWWPNLQLEELLPSPDGTPRTDMGPNDYDPGKREGQNHIAPVSSLCTPKTSRLLRSTRTTLPSTLFESTVQDYMAVVILIL
ncbi:hypothetical protein NM208_g15788 [Fusarium decemcellulare]|uniref:Uncharacterized protein n=1 Tax=Fusarium decemcellulare TaxID=57161 RepID=A0ACC1REP4_9HYPO|nr:hypothetical protein NM208_g15788 [Fusarium decemcellulare]